MKSATWLVQPSGAEGSICATVGTNDKTVQVPKAMRQINGPAGNKAPPRQRNLKRRRPSWDGSNRANGKTGTNGKAGTT